MSTAGNPTATHGSESTNRTVSVSVVIPTHNRQAELHRSVRSVLAQTDVDVEICVIDDGSTPPATVVADPRVSLFRHDTPQGVATARARGVSEANGEWIAFLDDDDLWAPTKLRRQLDAAEAAGASWAYAGAVGVDIDLEVVAGAPRGPLDPDEIFTRNTVPAGASNVLAKADLLAKVGTFDPSLRHMADWDFWIRLAKEGGAPASVSEPLVAYVQHDNNASLDTADIEPELHVIAERYGHAVDASYVHRWIAWSHLRSGDRFAAARRYASAVRAGDAKSAGRLAAALASPSRATQGNKPDPAWAAAADRWLADYRDVPDGGSAPTVAVPTATSTGSLADGGTKPVLDTITVIIPTIGRPLLRDTLASIAHGTRWPAKLVVSQQRSDPAPAIWVEELQRRGLNAVLIHNADQVGASANRNRGLEATTTPYACCTDDDCSVDPEWLDRMNTMLIKHDGKLITGAVYPEAGEDVPATITKEEPFEVTGPVMGNDPLFAGNMGLPMAAVDTVGYFDERPIVRYAEDGDYSHRLLRAGYSIRYEPSVKVTHAYWRDDEGHAQVYARYAYCLGGLYGIHARTGDGHMAKRAAYDMVRAPWFMLRGKVTKNEPLFIVGKQYLRYLVPGFIAGLRGGDRVNLP